MMTAMFRWKTVLREKKFVVVLCGIEKSWEKAGKQRTGFLEACCSSAVIHSKERMPPHGDLKSHGFLREHGLVPIRLRLQA